MFWLIRHRWFAGIVVLLIIVGYFWISSPGKVVVRIDGALIGIQNDIREFLQKDSFWKDQLYFANREQETLRTQPERDQKLRIQLDRMIHENRQWMEQYYRDNPSSRPSPATMQSNALREMADRIEQAELDQILDQIRRKRINELDLILQVCKHRAK
ncbi:hypothetical protein [Nitrosomonas sp. Nm166]|uniref:hypothetical protein n=1 Tax=Nitrosomonas sp. Nm166 TaxID=1881054 RepID=UPI0008E84D89|nr:hypothetical protein [Nitrosomonas sp. Nm166]SFE45915.1 hypothetical protein SAMN05428977_10173 [Nitrosomonas sp. Nm166]